MASELTEKAPWSLCQWLPTCSSCKCQDLSTSSRKQSYHLESRWRNFHYIGFAWPLTFSHLLGVLPSTFTTVYITTIELLNTLADYFSWMCLLHYPTLQKKKKTRISEKPEVPIFATGPSAASRSALEMEPFSLMCLKTCQLHELSTLNSPRYRYQ